MFLLFIWIYCKYVPALVVELRELYVTLRWFSLFDYWEKRAEEINATKKWGKKKKEERNLPLSLTCCVFQITKLKIDSNPFAKGFRDSSRLTDMERYRGFFCLTAADNMHEERVLVATPFLVPVRSYLQIFITLCSISPVFHSLHLFSSPLLTVYTFILPLLSFSHSFFYS